MIITIKSEDLNIIPSNSNRELFLLFINKVIMYLRRYQVKEIITNGHIASILQDNQQFTFEKLNNNLSIRTSTDPYLVGNLYDVQVKIDPQMRWDDNRIIPKDSILRLRKEKIFKILYKKEFEDFIEEIIIDKKLIDMLI